MADVNSFTMTARLVEDPELKNIGEKGVALLSMRVACNQWNGKEEEASFFNVKVWGARGESLAKILKKGSKVAIQGTMNISSYKDKEGNYQMYPFVKAFSVVPFFNESGGDGQWSEKKPAYNPTSDSVPPSPYAAAAAASTNAVVGDEDIPF